MLELARGAQTVPASQGIPLRGRACSSRPRVQIGHRPCGAMGRQQLLVLAPKGADYLARLDGLPAEAQVVATGQNAEELPGAAGQAQCRARACRAGGQLLLLRRALPRAAQLGHGGGDGRAGQPVAQGALLVGVKDRASNCLLIVTCSVLLLLQAHFESLPNLQWVHSLAAGAGVAGSRPAVPAHRF